MPYALARAGGAIGAAVESSSAALALALIGAPPASAHEAAGPRSDAIPAAKAAICEAAGGAGIAVDHTEDAL
jgi:hypothetical protein